MRHIDDESLVWHPRTGGCMVLKDSKPFLDDIRKTWCEEREIIEGVAKRFGCDVVDVFENAYKIFEELGSLGLVAREGWKERGVGAEVIGNVMGDGFDDDDSLLSGFCARRDIPAELHIDLTDACTERCVHCYVPQGECDFLAYESIEKVLRGFRAMNGLTVHLTGGEPMLHPDFEKVCRLCVKLNLNFIVFSNLTICDEKRIVFLKEVNPQFINVSLYSMDAAEHDAITCLPGSWQKTMDTILACEKAGVHIRLATPLLKANQGAFPALKQFADAHRMHLIPSCDIVPRANHTCSNLDYACSAAELERALSDNKELFNRNWAGEMPKPEDKVCDIGVARLYLNAKGDYYPCDCMHEYVLGNVRENTLAEVWKGEKLNYLRLLKNKDFDKCANCEHRPWCKVCPAFNFNATGNLFTSIPEKCVQGVVIHKIYGGK